MITVGDKLAYTATGVVEQALVESRIAELTEAVTRHLRVQALELHGWRLHERGADEVVGIPRSVDIAVSAVESGGHYLVTVTGNAVVDECVVDTRCVHDED